MVEKYVPTQEDRERIRPVEVMLKVSGDGVFATLQGEGITSGEPSVFLRLHYCNLTCGKPDGWKCDTPYTWDKDTPEYWQESEDWGYEETVERIEAERQTKFTEDEGKRLVITGGEPLLQQDKIVGLLEELPDDWEVEIETNGTIEPAPELEGCQFNCSPKLSNSGNSFERRFKPDVLRKINALERSQFKFVASSPEDLEEVKDISEECQLDPEKILIMPEGQTAEEVEEHAKAVEDGAKSHGWKIAMRNQLVWYGATRRT